MVDVIQPNCNQAVDRIDGLFMRPDELESLLQKFPAPGYRVQHADLLEHVFGVGGRFSRLTILESPGREILIQSIRTTDYLSLSDDSEDPTSGGSRITNLLQCDPVAEAIWSLLLLRAAGS